MYRRAATVTRSEFTDAAIVKSPVPVAIGLTFLGTLVGWLVSGSADEVAGKDQNADATSAVVDERIHRAALGSEAADAAVTTPFRQAWYCLSRFSRRLCTARSHTTELWDDPLYWQAEYQIMLHELGYRPITSQSQAAEAHDAVSSELQAPFQSRGGGGVLFPSPVLKRRSLGAGLLSVLRTWPRDSGSRDS
jgi:hypothetical protein